MRQIDIAVVWSNKNLTIYLNGTPSTPSPTLSFSYGYFDGPIVFSMRKVIFNSTSNVALIIGTNLQYIVDELMLFDNAVDPYQLYSSPCGKLDSFAATAEINIISISTGSNPICYKCY